MKIIIELHPDKDPERTLGYFYEKCLDIYMIGEIDKFLVSIEGTDLKKGRKK